MEERPPNQAATVKVERFVKAFEECSGSIADLCEVIGHDKDGLIAAFDDLLEEIRALRVEIAELKMAQGIKVDLGSILGNRRR